MKKVSVVGIGPGHPDWILPVAKAIITEADVVIGGPRQLKAISMLNSKHWVLEKNYPETMAYIQEHWKSQKIVVAVSGDTGFHSLIQYIQRKLPQVPVESIPGIGSLQYLFARVGLTWENAQWSSCHGTQLDLSAFTEQGKTMGLLTDGVWHPGTICRELCQQGFETAGVVIGEELSYPEERIRIGLACDFEGRDGFQLNGMILLNDEDQQKLASGVTP